MEVIGEIFFVLLLEILFKQLFQLSLYLNFEL